MGKPYRKGHERWSLATGKAEDVDLVPPHGDSLDLLFREHGFVKAQFISQRQLFDTGECCTRPAAKGLVIVTHLIDDTSCHIRYIYQGGG